MSGRHDIDLTPFESDDQVPSDLSASSPLLDEWVAYEYAKVNLIHGQIVHVIEVKPINKQISLSSDGRKRRRLLRSKFIY